MNFEHDFQGHEAHIEENVDEVVRNVLPWVHIIIGECRNGIAAIHKEVDKRFLQLYLNEYCWKFNRRFFRDSTDPRYDLFDRLVRIAAIYKSDIMWRDYTDPRYDLFDRLVRIAAIYKSDIMWRDYTQMSEEEDI